MRALVTGIGGFIAPHAARQLMADGHEVVGVDDFSIGTRQNVPLGIDLIEQDLANSAAISRLPAQIDVILHLAGQSSGEISFDDPYADLMKNTASTLNLIRYGIAAGAHRMIYASSMSVYGQVAGGKAHESMPCEPLSCYGVGKLAAERYLALFGHRLPFTIFRIFNVYGPGQNMSNLRQGMVSIFLAQALNSGRVQVKGGLDRFRDFIAVEDVARAWTLAATTDRADRQIFNLGTGRRTTVLQILEILKRFIPGLEWYVEGATPGDQSGIYADTEQIWRMLQFKCNVGLEEGIGRFISWARESRAI
jgi:UDP-glucose 4-epimerase